MMPIFMFGLGVLMIVGIGLLVAKDVKELIDFVSETNNNPTNSPLRV